MTQLIPFTEVPEIEIALSAGSCLYDKSGQEYLDLESGVWCTNLGHNNQKINRALQKQLEKVSHLGYQLRNPIPEDLAAILATKLKMPGARSVFLSSGSEAVDLCITTAKKLKGKKAICKIEDSYLSAYGQGKIGETTVVSIPNNDFEKLASTDFSNLAAFVFEPGTASGNINFASKEFISAVVKKARDHNNYLIIDEVTTGLGRTGKWFGFEHYRLKPDMVATGKALGNGYPVSAVTFSPDVADAFEADPFRYAQSHQNDPLGCGVALAVIKEIDRKDLVAKCEENGILFKSLLKSISSKYQVVKSVRGRGLMLAMEFTDRESAEKTHQYLFQERMIAGLKENLVRFMPPLIISHQQIHKVTEAIERSLKSKG